MSLAVQSGHTVLGQFESHKTQPLPPSSGNQLPQIQHSSLLLICDREPSIYLLVRRTCTTCTQYRDGHRECEWFNAQWLVHASTVGGLELFASYSRYRFSVGSGVITLLEPTVCSFAIMRLALGSRFYVATYLSVAEVLLGRVPVTPKFSRFSRLRSSPHA